MKHFDIAKWTDFVRGLCEKLAEVAIGRHLASGCRKCSHTAGLLGKLAAAVRRDLQVQVPDHALRRARAIFILQQPEKVQILPRIPARLLYDSFREPLPAGVRTQQRLSRQALYEAGDYSLDLRWDNERGSPRVALVGQIKNRKEPSKHLGDVPVLLVSGKKLLARTVSNSLGEFQMEYSPTKHLRLYVPVRQPHKSVAVRLIEFRENKTATSKVAAKEIPAGKREQKPC